MRAQIQNKMSFLTKIQSLTHKKVNNQEMEVCKYGPGKVFGEIPYVLPDYFKNYQPISVKCSSSQGEVLRISAIEFEKKILVNTKVFEQFKQINFKNIISNTFSKVKVFQTFSNFYSQKGEEIIDKQIN